MKKINLIFSALFLISLTGISQSYSISDFPGSNYKQVPVLIIGTHHYANPRLDDYQQQFPFDVYSDERQVEIEALVDLLSEFKPTKIGLEYSPKLNSKMDSLFSKFLDGSFQLPANEIYQLGFRLAKETGVNKVLGVDARSKRYIDILNTTDNYRKDLVEIGFQSKPNTKIWHSDYERIFREDDSLKSVMNLKDYLLLTHQPDYVQMHDGIYLVDSFKLGIGEVENYYGADMRTAWYNRNLRIFQNIYRLIDSQEDRILIIMGAGHLAHLTQMVKTSPELNLVSINTYLK